MRDKKVFFKKIIGPCLFLLLCGLTFSVIFGDERARLIAPALRAMDARFVAAAVAAALFFVAAEGFMLRELLVSVRETVSLASCVRYSFVGFFFSGITPSATGGQPMQLYEMHKDGVRTGNATVALMSVATAYKLALAVVGAGLLLVWKDGLERFLAGGMPLFYLGLFLNILLVVLLLGIMLGDGAAGPVRHAERLLVRFHLLQPSAERLKKLDEVFANYRETVDFLRAHKGKIVLVTAVTFLQRGSMFFLTWLIYRGMNLSGESMGTLMGLQAAVTICVDMLPLPGAQGITEMMYGVAFAGIFPAGLLLPSLCAVRGISFYLPLLVGAGAALYSRIRAGLAGRTGCGRRPRECADSDLSDADAANVANVKTGLDRAAKTVYDKIHTNGMYARGGITWQGTNFRRRQKN